MDLARIASVFALRSMKPNNSLGQTCPCRRKERFGSNEFFGMNAHFLNRHGTGRAALAAIFLAPALVHAATNAGTHPSATAVNKAAMFKLGFERINLSRTETMGMLGTSYLVEAIPHFYIGPAAYGAITGQRGGFFTAGGEVAWNHELKPGLGLQSGLFVGGGGGSSASMVGGGLMVRPHLDLVWKMGSYRAGLSASQVAFPNGTVRSNQIGVIFSADSKFVHVAPDYAGQHINVNGRHGAGFDRVLATAGKYRPKKGTTNLAGDPDLDTIGYAGIRMERLLSPALYWGLEASGAASGNAAGYAEFLGTIGMEEPIWHDNLAIGARLSLGMGGGGAVSVGGGQLQKLGAYATLNLSRDTHLSVEGGYASAPKGKFQANYGSVNFIWDLDHPGASGRNATIAGYEYAFGTERYLGAAYKDGSQHDLEVVTIKLNRYLNDSIYLAGQAHSAYSGNSGGYSVGLFGAGFRTRKFCRSLTASAEMLIGAAGGGSVDTSGGAIMQPMAYLGMDLSEMIGIKLGAGRVKSFNGALDSKVADLSVTIAFGAAGR